MKKTVLIFDDDVNILELCSIVLTECGYQVEKSETSHDILEKVAFIKPDAILMDNCIPKIGGIVATQLIKNNEQYKNIPVIYFSANSDIESLAKLAGADGYLAKPFDLEELEQLMKSLIG